MEGQFDIIVIGSGLEAWSAAPCSPAKGWGVCVTEQADVPGGCFAIVLPAGTCDRHGHALHRQHAGRRHHAPLFRIFRHPRLAAPAAARRGIRRRVAARSGRLRSCTVTKPSKSTSGNCSRTKRRGLGRYCAKLREIGGSIGIRVHRTGRLSAGGTKYLGAPAAGFIGECVADPLLRNVLAGTNPSTEACAKARRSTTTR